MAKSDNKLSKAISWLTLIYFIILFGERMQSIIRIVTVGASEFFTTGFDTFANITVSASLTATLVMLLFFNRRFWQSLTNGSVRADYSMMSITAGVALIGGMIHTEFTIAPIQFAAYGALIAAMVIRTAELAPGARDKFKLWYSLAFLTVFSMAIPVMYHSYAGIATIYHFIAAMTVFTLVGCFMVLMRRLFTGNGEDLLSLQTVMATVVLDAVLIVMRRDEEINWFALIFAALTLLIFIVGRIAFRIRSK
ncbi:MAG: hypothetical protein IJT87_02710 [Ruminiclostridium sp.]|nr:hypothetical protein [Ruminiclostridium sp.]